MGIHVCNGISKWLYFIITNSYRESIKTFSIPATECKILSWRPVAYECAYNTCTYGMLKLSLPYKHDMMLVHISGYKEIYS